MQPTYTLIAKCTEAQVREEEDARFVAPEVTPGVFDVAGNPDETQQSKKDEVICTYLVGQADLAH